MSNPSNTHTQADVNPRGEVSQGLIEYYSALANAALAQYDNIVHLLGQTKDWTAPGTACERLIRQLVRSSLPDKLSVDKGFIHGRRIESGQTRHSPEIDVLIHDSQNYAPLLRMDDFVIVQRAAVRGIIQVKRSMKSGTLKKAMTNLIEAKRHIRDCKGTSASFHPLEDIFSAFITFQDEVEEPGSGMSTTYENQLKEHCHDFQDGYLMPHFVGSLSRYVFVFDGLNMNKMVYATYPCIHNDGGDCDRKHMGLQVLLAVMARTILSVDSGTGPFAFPSDYKHVSHFTVWEKPGEGT